jgi:hypothetical protein
MENARQQTEKQEKRNEIVDGECTRLPWRAIREKIGKERLLCKKKRVSNEDTGISQRIG